MLTPNELDDYLAGNTGSVLELTYGSCESCVRFERRSENEILARIPEQGDRSKDPFDIESALSHPMCGAAFSFIDGCYVVRMSKRFQMRAVIKIALNHLNWHDEALIRSRFLNVNGEKQTTC